MLLSLAFYVIHSYCPGLIYFPYALETRPQGKIVLPVLIEESPVRYEVVAVKLDKGKDRERGKK